MATRTAARGPVRGFVVIWTFITVLIGIATFFAIYLAYDQVESNGNGLAQSAPTDPLGVAAVPTSDATPVPTREIPPTATDIPTDEPVVEVAQVATEVVETADGSGGAVQEVASNDTATVQQQAQQAEELPPIAQIDFTPGIQVQAPPDLNPDVQRAWMNDVKNMGFVTFKQQIRWEEIERVQGEYDWAVLDLVMPMAAEYNFNVVGSIVAAPDWARQAGANLEEDGPPADNQTFATFLTALLERYPSQFHALEIWNETNLEREWASTRGIVATDYIAMLRVAYQTIKNVDPGIIVISGAPSPTGGFTTPAGVVTAIDDFVYLDQMIEAGLLNYADCIGAHHNGYNVRPSYVWDNIPNDPEAIFRGPFENRHHSWSFRSTLETYANKVQVAGGDQRLCITEFGWPTVEDLDGYPPGFEFAVDNTLAEQAEWSVEALNLMSTDWDFVWIAIFWNLNYGPQIGWNTQNDNVPYSLIGPGYTKRPAYDAIAEWNANR